MSEDRKSIAEATSSILRDLSTPEQVRSSEPRGWNEELWQVLAASGFTTISVAEDRGGSGGDVADACTVLRELGRHAAAVPVAESSLVAGWALAEAGLDVPTGPVTSAVGHAADELSAEVAGPGLRLTGRLHRVPWAEQADRIALLVAVDGVEHVAAVERDAVDVVPGRNLAGESRDTVVLAQVVVGSEAMAPAPPHVDAWAMRLRGALARSAAAAGALSRVSDLTRQYTAQREQFGRPIASFQAVQRHVVRVAERAQECAIAAETAGLNAVPGPDAFDVACAKILAAESATVAAQASHQAHGAMGMTKEYELGQLTRRLWGWRDEWGSDGWWSRWLGHEIADAGADRIWPRVSAGRINVSA